MVEENLTNMFGGVIPAHSIEKCHSYFRSLSCNALALGGYSCIYPSRRGEIYLMIIVRDCQSLDRMASTTKLIYKLYLGTTPESMAES